MTEPDETLQLCAKSPNLHALCKSQASWAQASCLDAQEVEKTGAVCSASLMKVYRHGSC